MNQNQFVLQKVKRSQSGGLEVVYQTEERDGSEIFWDEQSKKCRKVQHQDLNNVLDRMKSHVARALNFSWIKIVMESGSLKATESKAFDQVEKIIEAGLKAAEDNIVVNGISLTGTDKKRQVIIMATMTTDNKKKVAINTPLILLGADIFGFESELSDDVEELMEETFLYLFKNKKAHLELFENSATETGTLRAITPEPVPMTRANIN